ncbi:hypothetical protein ACVXHB_08085 [Escherichia coli]
MLTLIARLAGSFNIAKVFPAKRVETLRYYRLIIEVTGVTLNSITP